MQETHQDDLIKCTVAIQESGGSGKILGTGVIVTDDVSIVTCYHVIGNLRNKTIDFKDVDIYFPSIPDIKGHANVLEEHSDVSSDIAFLQLQGKLPEQAAVANLSLIIDPTNEFRSFGFRRPIEVRGLNAAGAIRGKVRKKSKENNNSQGLIQLYSNEIGPGMSGAPVLDIQINRVIGIVSEHYRSQSDVDNNLSFAIPVESLLKIYPELKRNFGLNTFLQISPAFKKHLEQTKAKSEEVILNDESLHECYTEHDAVFAEPSTWNMKDEDIRKQSENQKKIEKVFEIIKKELLFQNKESSVENELPYLIIAGSYGIGKTALSKIIASNYADEFLDSKKGVSRLYSINSENNHYVPILLSLKESSIDEQDLYAPPNSLEIIFQNVCPCDNNKRNEQKILLVLDGLDDYKPGLQGLIRIINKYRIRYPQTISLCLKSETWIEFNRSQ